ncbi:hypothetical protein NDU88_006036 [Pleurodeles waltl]|uniref:Uncharacterized protein n=1 Tax=Pleurodeles waltl TaxID=8319 RepID=A0AAV7TX99_PLEWA|nr:hypothetical protein NDU88_006036 [Pleurodeles waltl]
MPLNFSPHGVRGKGLSAPCPRGVARTIRVLAPSSPLFLPGRGPPLRLWHLPPMMHRGPGLALAARSRVRPLSQRSHTPPSPSGALPSSSSALISGQRARYPPLGGHRTVLRAPSPSRRHLRSRSAQPQAEARQRPNSAGASPTGGPPMSPGVCDRSAAPLLSVSPCGGSGPD